MLNLKFPYLRLNSHKPVLFNLILWLSAFIILLFSWASEGKPSKIDYIYTFSFLTTLSIPVLINLYVLMPKFLKREKYVLYALFFLVNWMLFAQLNSWFFEDLIDRIFPDYYFISYHSNIHLFVIFGIFLFLTTLIKFAEDWFYFNKKENETLKMANQQVKNELWFLKSQINPHFLFNSLNVIYALALEKKEKTTSAILLLSDILRYVIYDSNTEKVSIQEEMKLIENYIAFNQYRQIEKGKISFNHSVPSDVYIYPMLLLPLVENSFKHGRKDEKGNLFLEINSSYIQGRFTFEIKNEIDENIIEQSSKYAGLGLNNIKNNLNLVYPNRHEFVILEKDSLFQITLKIDIN